MTVETFARFATREGWKRWAAGLSDFESAKQDLLSSVRAQGLVEPFSGRRFDPADVTIGAQPVDEGITAGTLNGQHRALLLQFDYELKSRGLAKNDRLKILGTEALSKTARLLRHRFLMYLGTVHAPDSAQREELFPIPHCDLADMQYLDESFDAFISAGGFIETPVCLGAMREIFRVLKPGGFIVVSVPFAPERDGGDEPASSENDDALPPQEGARSTRPEVSGSAVPREGGGWELLSELEAIGFTEPHFAFRASAKHGITGGRTLGVLTVVATKPAFEKQGSRAVDTKPVIHASRPDDPDAMVCVLGMPRSGTTLITSVLAVHSRVQAVFEPWNGKVLPRDRVPTFDDAVSLANGASLRGKTLVVKETAADSRYPRRLTDLARSAAGRTDVYGLIILRDPIQTMISEQRRRNEWWGDDVALDQRFVDNWLKRSRDLFDASRRLAKACRTTMVVTLEEISEVPQDVTTRLCSFIRIPVENAQLEYEKHLSGEQVRGDLNIARQPARITKVPMDNAAESTKLLKKLISSSELASWYHELFELHRWVYARAETTFLGELADRRWSVRGDTG